MIEHVVEVGVRVVSVPVQDVPLHVEVVSREVRGRILDGVELVPKHPPLSRRLRNDRRLKRHAHDGLPLLCLPLSRRRDDCEEDLSFGDARVGPSLGSDPDVDGQVSGPRPQDVAVLEVHRHELSSLVGGSEFRRSFEDAGDVDAVQDRRVDDDGHGVRVERLRAEGPHVGAVGQIQAVGNEGRPGLVALQDMHGPDEVDLSSALDVDRLAVQPCGALDKGLLHRGRIEQAPSNVFRNGAGEQSRCPGDDGRRDARPRQAPASVLHPRSAHVLAVGQHVRLDATVARRQFPGRHPPRRETRRAIVVGDATDSDDIVLVCRVVQCPVEGPVVSDGRHHDDPTRCDLQYLQREDAGGRLLRPASHLLDERVIEEIRSADAQVDDLHPRDDGVVEGVHEPRRVGDLVVREHLERVELDVGSESETSVVAPRNDARHERAVPQSVAQRVLVGPVRAFLDVLDVGVIRADARVEHTHTDLLARVSQLPDLLGVQDVRHRSVAGVQETPPLSQLYRVLGRRSVRVVVVLVVDPECRTGAEPARRFLDLGAQMPLRIMC